MPKLFSINCHSKTAGLSVPEFNDERVEIFFAGCKMAKEGHPCPGCFNSSLWSQEGSIDMTPKQIIDFIQKDTQNRYITIVGGEPLDQMNDLLALCSQLKLQRYNICLITHFLYETILCMKNGIALTQYVDILIDGKYDETKRIFDTDNRLGVKHVVGSSNQKIWCRKPDKTYLEDMSFCSDETLRKYYSRIVC